MAEVDRIAPPVPTLPAPIGRGVGSRRRRDERPSRRDQQEPPHTDAENPTSPNTPDHIDEYV